MMWWIPILTCVLALVATAVLHHYQKLPRILIKTRMVVILTYIAVAILGIGLGLLLREIVVANRKDLIEPVLDTEETLLKRKQFAEIEGEVQGFILVHKNDKNLSTLLEDVFTDLSQEMSPDEFLQLQKNIENWLKQNINESV